MSTIRSKDNIAAFTARTYREQDIAFAAVRVDIAGEDLIKTIVVPGARDVAWVADGDRRQWCPVTPETTRQLFGEVHGVAHRSAVPTAKYAVPRQQRGDKKMASRGYRRLGTLIAS
jgi:hypothetical protein